MTGWVATYSIVGLLAFALSTLFTAVLVRMAPQLGLTDEPGAQKLHARSTPVGGGIAIYLSLLPLLLLPSTRTTDTWILLLGGGLLALVGLIDDYRHVPATLKFLVLVGLTSLLWYFGVGAHPSGIVGLDFLLTVLWIAGVSSAFNAIDNMDGLATGVTAIAGTCFLVVALQTEQWVFGALSAALVGGSLGFLRFNFPPARIFMGDTGSFFLGFFLAALGVLGEWNSNALIAAVIPVLILGLPIFDLSFTVVMRHLRGITRTLTQAIQHCDTDHTSHRLVRLGLSHRQAVLLLYLIASSLGISAMTLRNAAPVDAVLHLLQALIIVAALVPILVLADRRRGPASPPLADPVDLGFTRRMLGLLALLALAISLA